MVHSALKKGVVLVLALVFAQVSFAASNWQQTSEGTCGQPSQCLVSNAFNSVFDNDPNAYWDGLANPAQGPKCIASGQYILDHYCNEGVWSSRTKLVASRLATLAVQSGASVYSVSCGLPAQVLPHDELTSFGSAFSLLGKTCLFTSSNGRQFTENCANNVCVLKYGNAAAIGFAVNALVESAQSPIRALNKPVTLCTNGIDSDVEYSLCGSDVWYDHKTQSVIYAPGVFRLPGTSEVQTNFFDVEYNKINSYVFANVHNLFAQRNFSSFKEPDLSELYYAKSGSKSVFAFRQSNVTLLQTDYFGVYFAGIALPSDACARVFKRFDDRSQCEVQPAQGRFFLVASKSLAAPPGLVDAYPVIVNSLRVV